MSKLNRYTQELFGSTAPANKIAEFGSFAAGSPLRYSGASANPALIQALSNFLTGWTGAVVGNNSPLIEDMNAVCFLFAYQLAYLMQEGVPEWDSGTTYYIGSLVSSNGFTYMSITNSNLGNPVTDQTNWAQPPQNGTVTPNTSGNIVVATGDTMSYPNLTVPNNGSVVVDTGANFVGFNYIKLQGNATFSLQGTASGKIF